MTRQDNWSVSRWMTPNPAMIAPDCSVKAAFIKMKKEGYRHLLVVERGMLVGIVSDRDLRHPTVPDSADSLDYFYRLDDDYDVRYAMTNSVDTVLADDYLGTALQLFREHKYGALPVLDSEGRVVGILTVHDIIRAFGSMLETLGSVVVPNVAGMQSLLTTGPGATP